MPKYYVNTGKVRRIVSATGAEEAAVKALRNFPIVLEDLGMLVAVSEQGFEVLDDFTILMTTDNALQMRDRGDFA